jgi:hypothetical protein
MINGSSPTFEDVRELLERDGKHPVFLHIEARQKGPHWTGWSTTTYAATQDPAYQALLRSNPNTGILLGEISGNLCAHDWDTDAALQAHTNLNPRFASTWTTRGARGGQQWAYEPGPRPRQTHALMVHKDSPLAVGSTKPPDENGLIQIGEYRADRVQSVCRGIHPSGCQYKWLVPNPPITTSFDEILWHNDIIIPWNTDLKHDVPDGNQESDSLIKRAITKLSIDLLWRHFGFPERTGNPVCSPFREDNHPSFSIYDQGRRFKDHGCAPHRGDSFNFYQLAVGKDSHQAFPAFVELAGLANELANAHKPNGASSEIAKEKEALILPSGSVEFTECAKQLFPVLAKRHRYFVRGRALVEVQFQKTMKDNQKHDVFQLLEPDAFRSRIELDFRCWAWRVENATPKLKETRCSHDTAKVLLKTDEAFEFLPHITTLSAQPVLVGDLKNLRVLYKGYHEVHGGIYVANGAEPLPDLTLEEARDLLLEVICDYDFVTESDKSRAIANFISPSLRPGKLLGDDVDFPIDISEANESQSGKTFRQKMGCAIYGETPYVIANRQGGVGSLDESISSALIAGIPFIAFENFRGEMRSQLAEMCLRGIGIAPARAPHKGEIQVPTCHINWQLSSNGFECTRDFGNRASITRVSKREVGHQFKTYPEGNILAHIKANQSKYLAAVFKVIRAWDEAGRPRTNEARHDFTEWAQTLDWIVQNIFNVPPLIDGHSEEILRVSNPALGWLRTVAIAVEKDKRLDEELLTGEIVDICHFHGLELPGGRTLLNPEQTSLFAGRLLGRIFHENNAVCVDRYQINRETRQEYDSDQRKNRQKHSYCFERKSGSRKETTSA